MEPLRWNEAKPKDHRTKHENQACLVADKGLHVANYSRASGGGRKMFLTSPLIDQDISLKHPCQDVQERSQGVRCRSAGRCSPLTAWRLAAVASLERKSAVLASWPIANQ